MRYWENEQPVTVDTGRNIIRFFKTAEKLQVSLPYWKDSNGQEKPGRTVTLDIGALRGSPEALKIIRQIAASVDYPDGA